MIEILAVALAWLVLTSPLAILIGKCISVGQAGETARHAAELHAHTTHAEDGAAAANPEKSLAQTPLEIPAQRGPAISKTHVS